MATFLKEYEVKGRRITLRNAEPEDAAEMLAVLDQLYRETTFLTREPGELPFTEADERTFLQKEKGNPNARFAVAVVDGRIAGSCNLRIGSLRRTRHKAELGIALLKAYWRMGIGRTLMADAIAWAGARGIEKIELTVDTQNLAAISLYQQLGFLVEGRQLRASKLADGAYRDIYMMGLFLAGGPDENRGSSWERS